MISSRLREIWCPYEARINTLVSVAEVEEQLLDWAVSAGFLADPAERERFKQARFGECAAYVYPDAKDLLIYAKWCAWLFVADDEFDENRGDHDGGIDEGVLKYMPVDGAAAARPRNAFTATLTELWYEIASAMPPGLQERFRYHVDQYGRSYGTDMAKARTGTAPTLEAYIDLRRVSGAVETCMDLIERQVQARVTSTPTTASLIRALRTATNDIVCWTNDVASVGKEVSHGELNNLVAVLKQQADLSWEKAEFLAARMATARTRDFHSAQQKLLAIDTSPEAAMFVEGLKHWITGSLAWHVTSPRYAMQLTAV